MRSESSTVTGVQYSRAAQNLLDRLYDRRSTCRLGAAVLVGPRRHDPDRHSQLVDRLPQRLVLNLNWKYEELEIRETEIPDAILAIPAALLLNQSARCRNRSLNRAQQIPAFTFGNDGTDSRVMRGPLQPLQI